MKKTDKTKLIAATFALAMGLSACGGDTVETAEDTQDVEVVESETYKPSQDDIATVYGPPTDFEDEEIPEESYSPADEEIACVYGPPPDFEDEEIADETIDDYDPSLEEVQDVYGPPPA